MIIEQSVDYQVLFAIAPIVAITIKQAKAIFFRDHNSCLFPDPHDCRGKMTIHHIHGKNDTPENLASVCHEAHWEYLHNGASEEQKSMWEQELSSLAREGTANATKKGWIFPG